MALFVIKDVTELGRLVLSQICVMASYIMLTLAVFLLIQLDDKCLDVIQSLSTDLENIRWYYKLISWVLLVISIACIYVYGMLGNYRKRNEGFKIIARFIGALLSDVGILIFLAISYHFWNVG